MNLQQVLKGFAETKNGLYGYVTISYNPALTKDDVFGVNDLLKRDFSHIKDWEKTWFSLDALGGDRYVLYFMTGPHRTFCEYKMRYYNSTLDVVNVLLSPALNDSVLKFRSQDEVKLIK